MDTLELTLDPQTQLILSIVVGIAGWYAIAALVVRKFGGAFQEWPSRSRANVTLTWGLSPFVAVLGVVCFGAACAAVGLNKAIRIPLAVLWKVLAAEQPK